MQIQTCIEHLIRNSLEFVGWKERKSVAAELKSLQALLGIYLFRRRFSSSSSFMQAISEASMPPTWHPTRRTWRC